MSLISGRFFGIINTMTNSENNANKDSEKVLVPVSEYEELKNQNQRMSSEIDELKHELEHATDGRVHVLETIYHGARIVIGNCTYKVIDDVSYASFRYKNGEIVYGPCEVSKPK